MVLRPNDCGRLTLQELEEYRFYSGITERQYKILKRKFYDNDEPNRQIICDELNICEKTYNSELKKALKIISKYKNKK